MLKILIAEYDDDVLACLKDFFEEANDFQVLTARSPEEIIPILKIEKPDWMFLSLESGSKKPAGLEILQCTKSMNLKTKVVMMTVDHRPETTKRVLELGAVDCIVKPDINEPLKRLLLEMKERKI